MKVFQMLKIDTRLGVYKKRYLALIFIYLIPFAQFLKWRAYLQESQVAYCTLADCMGCVFQGTYPFVRTEQMDDFIIPTVWFALVMYILFLPLEYPTKAMQLWGEQYTIRSGKVSWWISKYCYTLICIICAFAILLLEMMTLCKISGVKITWRNTPEFYQLLFGQVNINFQQSLHPIENVFLFVIMPFLGLITLSVVQLFLSVWIRPVIAYIMSIISLVFTVYYDSAFLPGNNTMAIRSAWIDPEGVQCSKSIVACCSICIIIFVVGCLMIRRKELIRFKKEEI